MGARRRKSASGTLMDCGHHPFVSGVIRIVHGSNGLIVRLMIDRAHYLTNFSLQASAFWYDLGAKNVGSSDER